MTNMQKLVSHTLWKEVRTLARKARKRSAAIAYVTRDLLGFKMNDILVVNASKNAIATAETDAKLLRSLFRRKVRLYDCSDLHAKVLLLDDIAVIGSGNMSSSSERSLVEAGLITDHASTVSGVASFIEQLVEQSEPLTKERIADLCKIKVVRRGGAQGGGGNARQSKRRTILRTVGTQTWLVGVRELVSDPKPDEQRMIDKAEKSLRVDDVNWLRWSGNGRFCRECREGNTLIQIWRPHGAKRPKVVMRPTSVLLKQRTARWSRFYLQDVSGRHAEMPWGKFKRLLKRLGYPRKVGPAIEHALDPEMADAIARNWNAAFRAEEALSDFSGRPFGSS